MVACIGNVAVVWHGMAATVAGLDAGQLWLAEQPRILVPC